MGHLEIVDFGVDFDEARHHDAVEDGNLSFAARLGRMM